MQEVFEKIIGQLESKAFERYGNEGIGGQMVIDCDDAIETVKRAAEGYDNGWIPSERSLRKIIEKFSNIYRVVENDEDLGWNRAVYKCEEIVNQIPKERGTTNFDKYCESMEAMAQIIEIAKIGWTKQQIMEWLQKEAEQPYE